MSSRTFPIQSAAALLVFAGWFAGLRAAELPGSAPLEVPALTVHIGAVSEMRESAGGGRLQLNLRVVGEGPPSPAVLRKIVLVRAVDERGRPIPLGTLPGGTAEFLLRINPGGQTGRINDSNNLSIPTPPRGVESIALLEGRIELQFPSTEPGGTVRVRDLKNRPGVVQDPLLTRSQVELEHYYTQAAYEAAREKLLARLGDPTLTVGDAGFPLAAVRFVRDPHLRTASIRLVDGSGREIDTAARFTAGSPQAAGFISWVNLFAPLPDEAELVIVIRPPDVIRSVPFRVENIPLP